MMEFNPYYLAMTQMGNTKPQSQDLSGLSPVFQNISQQQAMQNMAAQQAQGLTQQAGQPAQGGMNPMAMAQALRGQTKANPYLSSIPAMLKYGSGNVYGGFGQGQVPTTSTGMD